MNRNVYLANMPLARAREAWEAALRRYGLDLPMPAVEIPVDQALGRITAEAVRAPGSSPSYHAAAMDGIAVRYRDTIGAAEDTPVRLRENSGFVRVNTGNPLPEGFDAVIMIEDVQPAGDREVEIIAPVPPWKHVRAIGEDIVATELILPSGQGIRPIDLGALLATGCTSVMVRSRPRALVIPTGSELVQPGREARPGNIIEFNSRILTGYLTEWGVAAERGEIVSDDRGRLRRALEEATADYDLVLVNAGASAGSEDHTVEVLRELGEVVVHGVNIKPGKPVILAIVNGRPVVGLPGYPVSAVLCLRQFVQPLVEILLGTVLQGAGRMTATLARPLASAMGVEEFIRVKLGRVGEKFMASPGGRGAGAIMSLLQADGIITVPAGSEGIGTGEKVSVELLRRPEEIENTLVFIGSHDNILDVLADMLPRCRNPCRLSSAHVGSMGGITSIGRGEAHVAGSHLLDPDSGEYNIPFIRRYLPGVPLRLINLVHRRQGLLVRPGNPLNIQGVGDLTRPEVRFINRQRGAGTRLLTDLELKRLGIKAGRVTGYEREEYTHMNVAAAVAGGAADTGMGIRTAALALGLDFIPITWERYDLIIPAGRDVDPKILTLLELLRDSSEFRETVTGLGGYDLRECGRLMYEQ